MVSFVLGTLSSVVEVISGKGGPRAIAAGIVLGMILGWLPKDNLTAFTLATIILATYANLAAATLSTLLFSCLSQYSDPVAIPLGEQILTSPMLVPLWTTLAQVPLAIWFAFHHTAVMGNLALGLLVAGPLYLLLSRQLAVLLPAAQEFVDNWHLAWLFSWMPESWRQPQ